MGIKQLGTLGVPVQAVAVRRHRKPSRRASERPTRIAEGDEGAEEDNEDEAAWREGEHMFTPWQAAQLRRAGRWCWDSRAACVAGLYLLTIGGGLWWCAFVWRLWS